jgi:nucleotide-binding universal stress UspA family protein
MIQVQPQSHSPDTPTGSDGKKPLVIVVGLDGSPTSWDAFSWAAGQAAGSDGQLIAVYAAPPTTYGAAVGAPIDYAAIEQVRKEVAAQLKDEAQQRAEELGVPVRFVLETGEAVHALTDVAHSTHADLIVVGKSAKMLHHFARSLGRRLVSRHDTPVTVVVP